MKLPEDWQTVPISALCRTTRNRTVNPLSHPDEEFEYYSIPAFQERGEPVIERGERILSQKQLVEDGTVLFGKLNPRVLKVWQVKSRSDLRKIATTEFLPMVPRTGVVSEFVYYLCQSRVVSEEACRLVTGSTPSRERVDPTSFYRIQVPLPPEPQQRAIARALQAVRDSLDARRREIVLELERRDALADYFFRDWLTSQTEAYETRPLGDIATFKNGINFNRTQKGRGTLTVDVLNMYGGGVDIGTDRLYRVETRISEEHLLKPDDILFVRSSLKQEGVGWAARFPGHSEPVSFCGFLIRARIEPKTAYSKFLVEFLRLPETRRTLV